ncbi:MAG: PepSY domain-containing protein [Deltaproteobacteria bacterium]|nr:PepSY domain-containing protein [Deltaproteobacteria bacterium]
MRRATLYASHRWISAVALVQLAVWTGTGLFFAVVPIERVRGSDRTAPEPAAPLPLGDLAPLPAAALAGAEQVTLRLVDGRPAWVASAGRGVRRWLVDARSGERVAVDAAAAERIARADQVAQPRALRVERVEAAPVEYRGGPVPAWRVDLDDGRETRVYVDAATGAVKARRNGVWRVYDFLFGLHIMDYGGREDFNTPLLAIAAAVGVATSLSGLVLWAARLAARRQAQPARR